MTPPARTQQWPVEDFCDYVHSLELTCLPCDEYHYLRGCYYRKALTDLSHEVTHLTKENIDARFLELSRRVFDLLHSVICKTLKKSIRAHGQEFFSKKTESRLKIYLYTFFHSIPERIMELVNQMAGTVDL